MDADDDDLGSGIDGVMQSYSETATEMMALHSNSLNRFRYLPGNFKIFRTPERSEPFVLQSLIETFEKKIQFVTLR